MLVFFWETRRRKDVACEQDPTPQILLLFCPAASKRRQLPVAWVQHYLRSRWVQKANAGKQKGWCWRGSLSKPTEATKTAAMHTAALLSITSDYTCALQCSSLLVYPGVTTDLTGLRIQTLMVLIPSIGNATRVGLGSYRHHLQQQAGSHEESNAGDLLPNLSAQQCPETGIHSQTYMPAIGFLCSPPSPNT